jgi:hypothetical protein
LASSYRLRCTFWRGGVCSYAQCRVDVGQSLSVSPDHSNSQALAGELMGKRPANTATSACNKSNVCHAMPCETGVKNEQLLNSGNKAFFSVSVQARCPALQYRPPS